MTKHKNPEEGMYALKIGSRILSVRQTIALFYITFSALFSISVFLFFTHWFFIVFLFYLSAFTVFSVPNLIFLHYSTQSFDWLGRGYFIMIPMALFYALVAYGLLKKKRAASVATFISSLLTIFADISISYLSWSVQDLTFLGLFVSGSIFNILFLVLISQDKLRRR
ncbi:MAG: hypothetical protein ACUVRA_09300 [Candidatus Bathyarchaeaceae archaeon]